MTCLCHPANPVTKATGKPHVYTRTHTKTKTFCSCACGVMDFPAVTGCFSKSELVSLAENLGYPGQMLVDGLKASRAKVQSALHTFDNTNSSISTKYVVEILEEQHLNRNLEHLFNNHSAQYNQKVIKKAIYMLQHHKLSFSDLYKSRISFELYSEPVGGGMRTDAELVVSALKMAGRTIAPLELESLLKRHQNTCDIPPNIQLYEFMDFVASAVSSNEVKKEIKKLTTSVDPDVAKKVTLSNYERMLMTEDEQHLAYLDRKYRASMYKEVKPKAPTAQFSRVQLVSSAARQRISATAHRELQALTPCLEVSQMNAQQARNGAI